MIQLLLLLAVLIIVSWGVKNFLDNANPGSNPIKTLLLNVVGVALIIFMATSMSWIFLPLVAFVLLPKILRAWAVRLNIDPNTYDRADGSQQQSRSNSQGKMSHEEAYEVLGLKQGASQEDIVAAHRKLIQKNHPDRGGSDYLASKINLAKKTLLNR